LAGGCRDFEIEPGGKGEPWHAGNGRVGVTVYASACNTAPGKTLGGVPALIFKDNRIRNACTPAAYREQTLIAELNGVFVHVMQRDGTAHVVVADRRLED
jgi:hypothetical protein